MKAILSLDSRWILITSLFYEGPVEAKIKIKDYSRKTGLFNYRETFYNIYSINTLSEIANKYNYCIFFIEPFEIKIDIPKPSKQGMGTYTIRLKNNKRIQISGPLLMPWYTVLLKNNKLEDKIK